MSEDLKQWVSETVEKVVKAKADEFFDSQCAVIDGEPITPDRVLWLAGFAQEVIGNLPKLSKRRSEAADSSRYTELSEQINTCCRRLGDSLWALNIAAGQEEYH